MESSGSRHLATDRVREVPKKYYRSAPGSESGKLPPTNALSCSALAIDRRLTFESRDAAHKLPRSRLTPVRANDRYPPFQSFRSTTTVRHKRLIGNLWARPFLLSLMRRRAPTRCLLQILGLRTETQVHYKNGLATRQKISIFRHKKPLLSTVASLTVIPKFLTLSFCFAIIPI